MQTEEARAVVPRAAATVLILRDRDDGGIEVLMVRRSAQAKFMPNAYVFPGGAVDEADADVASDEADEALRARLGRAFRLGDRGRAFAIAADRECFEECGLWLGADDPQQDLGALRERLGPTVSIGHLAAESGLQVATSVLQPWSRWVTPLGLPRRFDTVFFVCRSPSGQTPEVDAGETTTLQWVDPGRALAAQSEGAFQMEFATRAIVRSLLPFAKQNVAACLDHARALSDLAAVHPRLRRDREGKVSGVLLPGEPGYDELPGDLQPIV